MIEHPNAALDVQPVLAATAICDTTSSDSIFGSDEDADDTTAGAGPTRGQIIAYARERYADPSDDDIEIDDSPLLSEGTDGAFVQAWVWVPYAAVPVDQLCDEG